MVKQEVSEMLGGRISNQDEDEVEDELAALEAEVAGKLHAQQPLPSVPDTQLPTEQESQPERRPERPRQDQARQAMLAS